MINLNGIYKNYTTRDGLITALENINLTVKAGEIYGIVGRSGAGKSTLIRCVNLLEKPTSGKVIVDNTELTQLPLSKLRIARRNIGMIFQHFNLLSCRTVYQNVSLPLEFCGVSKSEILDIVEPLLELTGLREKRNDFPRQLSGGQKQRVAIARALASKPKVLLSDEATSSLDPETTAMILELLKNIRDSLNLTILLITHEMNVVKSCCDRVGILHEGKLIEENEIGAFFSQPQTDIAKNFILSSMKHKFPLDLEKKIIFHSENDHLPIIRLWFFAETANKPIVSHLVKQYGLQINILQAHIEYIKNHVMGIMVIAVDGEKDQITRSIEFLKNVGVNVEVIGYVPNYALPVT